MGACVQLACVVPLLLVVDADPISTCKGKSAERWVELGISTRLPPKIFDRRVGQPDSRLTDRSKPADAIASRPMYLLRWVRACSLLV